MRNCVLRTVGTGLRVGVLIAAISPSVARSQSAPEPQGFRYGVAIGIPVVSLPLLNAGMIGARTTWQPSRRINLRGEATVIYRPDRTDVFSETPPCPSTCPP